MGRFHTTPAESALKQMSPEEFREGLQRVSANRHSAEAAALYKILFDYTVRRMRRTGQRMRMADNEREEVVSDTMLQLMRGGLATFRGGSLPELLAFVRTITDRTAWKRVRARDRERAALDVAGEGQGLWTGEAPPAPNAIELAQETPLPEKDRLYLTSLLRAGTKAELARREGVSRAAVTQRVQRITRRIAAMGATERATHDAWLQQAARIVAHHE